MKLIIKIINKIKRFFKKNLKKFDKYITNRNFNKKVENWIWMIILWIFGVFSIIIITLPIKLFFKLI
ncbi:hypothetical protein Lyticum_00683 [Lyticum sinuosum]|uniref:Uncharacterized protein n=1 Tax=Lyticum sinuosum TaxID=1332059 RepID=A0AAE4VKI8_9RICK|nr:hypothetical protein [Lyticum sinuosum]